MKGTGTLTPSPGSPTETFTSFAPDNLLMDDRICPLISGRNGLLLHCLGEKCRACRHAVTLPDGGNVSLCSACDHPPIDGGR